jgi:outer membrane immunogenic protein
MQKLLLTALLTSVAIPALAADLPVKAPARVVPAIADWTGFYIGIHGGYGWGDAKVDEFDLNGGFGSGFRLNQPKPKGWVFGGHAGYNYQWSRMVGGIEIDYSGANLKDDQSRALHFSETGGGLTLTEDVTRKLSAKIDALASARARLGVLLVPDFLLYGTGGVAWGHTNADMSFRDTFRLSDGKTTITLLDDNEATQAGANHFGWVAGAGGEWAVFGGGSGWRLRAEYLHYDFGRTTQGFSGKGSLSGAIVGQPIIFGINGDFNAKLTADVVRGGLSYKF